MIKKLNKKSGFTLIEMVIVISILGILSGVGMMKFGDIQQEAKLNTDYITAQNLAKATELAIIKMDISSNNTSEEIMKILVDKNYITQQPTPQSIKQGQFNISINQNKVQVVIYNKEGSENNSDIVLYPKPKDTI